MNSDSDYPAMRRARSPRRHRHRWRSDLSEDEEEPHRRRSSSSSSDSSSGRSSSSSISRSSSNSDSSSGRSSSNSDSSSDRSSNSRRRSRRSYRSRSRSRSPRRSRSRSRNRSRSRSHGAAADNEFTVRIDNYDDLFNCALCHGLLSSPVYECGDGHLTCHRCYDLGLMSCIRCGSKDYTRSRAVATMVRSVRFACRNREHGCAASLPRLGVEDHEHSCRYEPCFCPVCKRAFVPGALEEHLTGRHAWHLHHLTYGEEVLVDVDPHRHALLRADDGELFHLDLSRVRRTHAHEDGTSISVIHMRPDNAAGAEADFSYEVKPPGAAWRMQAPVWSSSLRRGMEDGNRIFVTVPEAGRHRHFVNVCIWRLPART